jgi:hypothetical protein
MVGVAQLAERQVVVLDVAGSNPVAHPSENAGQEGSPEQRAILLSIECPILGASRESILLIGTSSRDQAAHHEAGHAVARWALDLPILRVTLDGSNGPVTEPLPGGLITDGQRDLVAACGCIADYQYRGLKMRSRQALKTRVDLLRVFMEKYFCRWLKPD